MRRQIVPGFILLVLLFLCSGNWACLGAISAELDNIETLISENKLADAEGKISGVLRNNLDTEGKSFLRYQEARIVYMKKDYPKTLGILNEIIAQYPGTPKAASAKYLKGYTAFYQDDYETSKQSFKDFADANPKHPCAPDASLRFACISFLGKDKTIKEKKELFQKVIDLYPGSSEAYEAKKSAAALSWAESEQEKTLEKKQQVEQMYKALEKEAKSKADKGFAALHLAAVNLEMERAIKDENGDYPINYDLVIELCNKALEVAPESEKETRATASLIKSECLYYSQDPDKAIEAFKDLLGKYSPEEKCRTQTAFAQYMLAMAYMKKQDAPNAEKSFQKVLTDFKDAPNFKGNNVQATSLLWLAQMTFDQEKYEESSQYISQIKTLYPDSSEANMASNLLNLVNSAKKGVGK